MLPTLNSLTATVGAFVLTVIVLAGILEIAVRLWRAIDERFLSEHIARRDFIDHRYHPYLERTESWAKAMFSYLPIGFRLFNLDNPLPGYVENNSLGYRCGDFTDPDPAEFRVVVLGGSTAWGSGASSNEATVAGQLEKLLNDDPELLGERHRARVYNLAQINGYQTQDILSTVFQGSRLKPHLVVSLTGWNELFANYPMKVDLLEKYRTFYITEMEGWEPIQVGDNLPRTLREALEQWLRGKLALADAPWLRPRKPESGFDYSLEELRLRLELTSELFVEHLRHLNALGRTYGYKHIQFLQPNLYGKRHLAPAENRVIELYHEARPIHGGAVTGSFLRNNNIYEKVLLLAGESPDATGPVIDLSDMFRDDRDHFFYTLAHLTDAGYRRIAERMYQSIKAVL